MSKSAGKERLDVLIVQRGLAETRQRAQGLILGGAVTVAGVVVLKAGTMVNLDAEFHVGAPGDDYVGRGALKLVAGLDAFATSVGGRIALDVGASTGGFTDVLLRRGAERVYAIDVGYGQLAWRLREDARVVVMERTNFRFVDSLPEAPSLIVVDVSFISLSMIFPVMSKLAAASSDAITLIKPQFEAGKGRVGKGGVVRDPQVHRDVLQTVVNAASETGWVIAGLIESPIRGPAGNREFVAHFRLGEAASEDPDELIQGLVG